MSKNSSRTTHEFNHTESTEKREVLDIKPQNPESPFLIVENRKPTHPSKPEPSKILEKVKAFLPQIHQANQQLEEALKEGRSPEDFNIEVVDESKPYIEMNIGLMEESSSSNDDEDTKEEDVVLNTNRNNSNSSPQQTSDTSDSEEMLTLVSSSLISTKHEQNTTDNSQITKHNVVSSQSNGFDIENEVHKDDNSQSKSENIKSHEVSQRRKRTPHTRSHKKQRTKKPKIEEINKDQ